VFVGCAGRSAANTKKSETRLELAQDFLRKGELEAAALEAQKALGYDDRNAEALGVLGLVSYLHGVANFRLLEVEDCITGPDAEVLRKEMDKELLDAERYFGRAVAADPDYGEAWSDRGSVALQLGNYEDAIRYFERALSSPARLQNGALTRANLGWAYFHTNAYAKAVKELLQAQQFQPGMCVASYRLGRVYFARKEWEKAQDQFDRVVLQSSCPIQEAHLYLMKTYARLGMAEKLDAERKECVAGAPASCVAARCRSVEP
jgi:tetratricopeptide (TPR) repeat protein